MAYDNKISQTTSGVLTSRIGILTTDKVSNALKDLQDRLINSNAFEEEYDFSYSKPEPKPLLRNRRLDIADTDSCQ